jgi:hypothetical protein
MISFVNLLLKSMLLREGKGRPDVFFCPVCLSPCVGGPSLEAYSHTLYGFQITCSCGIITDIRRAEGGVAWYAKPVPDSIQKKLS